MKIEKAKGIVLKVNVFQEADLIVSVLLQNGAKKDFIAKHALKSKRRFSGGVLEASHYIEFSYKESLHAIAFLEEARMIESFDGLRTSYDALQGAIQGIQLILKVTKEDLEHEENFHLLGNYLKLCAQHQASRSLFLHFKVRLLSSLGILPAEAEFVDFQKASLATNKSINKSEHDLLLIERGLRAYEEEYKL